ncbi:MAG: DsbA family protein [Pseudomonadota bacterium]
MTLISRKTLLSAAALMALTSAPAMAQDSVFSDAQKEALGPLIEEYLLNNPSVILKSLEMDRSRQREELQKQAEMKIADNIEALANSDAPTIGNPDGDITVVEFFDYNCGYCKRALPDVQAALESDDNLKVVFKEMPILGPSSRTAALWALAAHKQDKYFEYHVALMEHKGAKDDAVFENIAKDLALDLEQMRKDIESDEIKEELDGVLKMAREIGVSGTPAFIVGTTFIPGYIGEEGLKAAIAAERKKNEANGG